MTSEAEAARSSSPPRICTAAKPTVLAALKVAPDCTRSCAERLSQPEAAIEMEDEVSASEMVAPLVHVAVPAPSQDNEPPPVT